MPRAKILFLVCAALSLSVTPAHAYLDPGTGSIILQSVIGGAVVAGSFVSIYWSKLKAFLSRKKTDASDEKGEQ